MIGNRRVVENLVATLRESDGQVQRLIAQADGYAKRVAELEGQLARTQEWMERFQGTAAEQTLEAADMRVAYRTLRTLLVEADSNLGLWRHRYDGVRMPDDLREDVDDLRRRIHPWVTAGGRGETVHAAASRAVSFGSEGSTPSAPTREPYFGSCTGCHGCSNCKPPVTGAVQVSE